MNAPRFAQLDDIADQLLDVLVVEGAILDGSLVVRAANPTFMAHCGITGSLGRTLYDFMTDEGAKIYAAELAAYIGLSNSALRHARKGDRHFMIDLRLDALVPPLNMRLSRMTGRAGFTIGYMLQAIPNESDDTPIDHTLLRRAADELRVSKNKAPYGARAIAAAAAAAGTPITDDSAKAMHHLGHGYWEVDYSTGLRSFSDAWYRMRGLKPGPKTVERRETWTARLHPDDVMPMMNYLARLRAGNADYESIVYRERHSAGHFVTILAQGATLIRDANGKPLLNAGTDVDITESISLTEKDRALADVEQRWLIASEYGKIGLWDNNTLTGRRYVSQTWRQMRGYGPDDDFDESREALVERTHPDDQDSIGRQIKATVEGETDTVFQEYRERHRNGHYIHILSRGRVIARNNKGIATRIIGIDTDISEIKAQNDELRQMSRRLELALATSQIGVWEVDVETLEAHWDDRMMEIYGQDKPGGLIAPGLWESHIHPDDLERLRRISHTVDQGDGTFWGQYRIIRPDGVVRQIRARSTEVIHESGRRHLIGVDADVTADVEAEEALRKANALAHQRNKDLERARAEMEHNALHDALTGLPNRRYLDQIKHRKRDSHARIAIMQMDLDRFKQINDTLGHAAGDSVLSYVAKVLSKTLPETSFIARIGGDEFVVFMENAPEQEVLGKLADDVIARIGETLEINGQDCRFGVSIGIALGCTATQTADEVMENADLALYEAKSSGKSQKMYFADRMRIAAERKRRLADAILGGLDRDEFFCVYQPQFDSETLALSGLEALIRWRMPDGTIEAPNVFLSIAEELNIEDQFDALVLRQVLDDQAQWESEGLAVPRVSVNVSARRLSDSGLAGALEGLNIQPGRISFELLETVFLDIPDPVIAANIAAIRALGIGIEIDDFGTGHASLVGMLRLQPDRLKIDRELVNPLGHGERAGILVRSIIDIGRMHGIEIIAEGVETPDQIRLLAAMGCHYLQGFALAMPMSENEMRRRLRAGTWRSTTAA